MGYGIISMVILSIAINVGILVWRVSVESIIPKAKRFCSKRTKTMEDK
jgi:hypothetical protein